MGDKLILKDGTEIEGGAVSLSAPKQIYVSVPGTDLVSAVQTFSDPKKTEEMTYLFSVYKKVYKGFTSLGSAGISPSGDTVELYLTGDDPSVESSFTVPEEYLPESMRPEGYQKEEPGKADQK
jgi:hypothetical protein